MPGGSQVASSYRSAGDLHMDVMSELTLSPGTAVSDVGILAQLGTKGGAGSPLGTGRLGGFLCSEASSIAACDVV